MKTETRRLDEINSQGIEIEATRQGVDQLDFLGKYSHPEHPDSNDWTISIYRFPNGTRVASTSGDPVWEESDPQAFAEILEEYQVKICSDEPAKQTLKQWFNEHTSCGFDEITCAQGHGDLTVETEYWDGTYQLCKTSGGFVWMANGTESVGYETSDLSGFGQDESEVREKLEV